MESLATLVPDREREWVCARADRLYHDSTSRGWPGLGRSLCLVIAAIAPALRYDRLALLARYAGWTIRLDDRLDRPDPDPADLRELRDAVAAVTAAAEPGRPAPADPVVRELARLLAELAGLDRSGGAALARLRAELRSAVASGVQHALLGQAVTTGRAPPPAAEAYLATAARTVNYRSFGYALLALIGGDPLGTAVDRALWHAAEAVRLANDLRSLDRDRAEATLNVLWLRTATGDRVTGRWVRTAIDRRVRAHDWALASTDRPGRVLTRSLHVSVGLYRLGDLREPA